jgi:hypothetical protein
MPRHVLDGARVSFAQQVLSLEKTCSIGLRSGEYFGRKNSLAPAARISWRTARPLWLPRLSMMTMSPALSVGKRNCSTPAFAGAGSSTEAGAVDRAVDDAGCRDAVATQGCQEGQCAPAPVRHLGNETAAAGTAPVPAGHVGLGPGLVDEDQALGIKPALMLLQRERRRATSGRSCSLACRLFFERDPLAGEERPHRAVTHHHAAHRQLGQHRPQGQVRLLGNPRHKPIPLVPQNPPSMSAHRLGSRSTGRPITLRPLHHARHANPKQRRRCPARATACHRTYNTIP